ncbi:MAG: four helix bundle protein [Candidatus Brocadiia bacterium]
MNSEETSQHADGARQAMEPGNSRTWDIRDRTFEYSLRAVRLHQSLQAGGDRTGWLLGRQYLRAATSIGANIAEAQSAESKADFLHKCAIAQKEARESLYWLQLLDRSGIVAGERLGALLQETDELIAVIASIILSTKRRRD